MRTTLLIERYRKFAARTRMSMALLALSLFAAIWFIFAVGAHAAEAAFLDSEARNVASLHASSDRSLLAVATLIFAAALVFVLLESRRPSLRR